MTEDKRDRSRSRSRFQISNLEIYQEIKIFKSKKYIYLVLNVDLDSRSLFYEDNNESALIDSEI